jgi:hypothetical protein
VVPGRYLARLTVGGQTYEQPFQVHEDPRLDIEIEARKQWMRTLFALGDLYEAVLADAERVLPIHWQLEKLEEAGKDLSAEAVEEVEEVHRLYTELLSRIRTLYGQVDDWTGPMTADQRAQMAYYAELRTRLRPRAEALRDDAVRRLNRRLKRDERIVVDG